jgi:S1-C subfamily serine protease
MKSSLIACSAFAVVLSFTTLPAFAADAAVKAKAREVLDKNKDAVVSVKMVISMRYVFGGRESHKQEHKTEVTGTIVDASGLVVLANSAVNPYGDMDFSFASDGENQQMKPETSITDIMIVTADGKEIPGEFSLKDKDLDLAFVRPKEKLAQPLPFIAFAKTADPEVLEDVIVIGRLGRLLNRASSIGLGSVEAVVKKPRTFYVADVATGFTSMGCPVFNSKGEPLGLSVVRKSPVKDSQSFDIFGGQKPVILPAEDLMEIAKQALNAKLDEKPAEEPKKEEAATK